MIKFFGAAAPFLLVSFAAIAQDTEETDAPVTSPEMVDTSKRKHLGTARIFNNDILGDGRDRWRTGSLTVGVIRGPEWNGALPSDPGEILHYRLHSEIIAPESLRSPAANDRLYSGILSFGIHTHFDWNGKDVRLGADLQAAGEQTGLRDLQDDIHDTLGIERPTGVTEIANISRIGFSGEISKAYNFGEDAKPLELRPFLEVQTGLETYARLGADVTFGGFGFGGLRVRDSVTGQRTLAIAGTAEEAQGLAFTLGGDVTHVESSAFLPESGPAELENTQFRARVGVNWQGESTGLFTGVTYLSEEFTTQTEGQVVGSINFRWSF